METAAATATTTYRAPSDLFQHPWVARVEALAANGGACAAVRVGLAAHLLHRGERSDFEREARRVGGRTAAAIAAIADAGYYEK
jgi:hypothetical protein